MVSSKVVNVPRFKSFVISFRANFLIQQYFRKNIFSIQEHDFSNLTPLMNQFTPARSGGSGQQKSETPRGRRESRWNNPNDSNEVIHSLWYRFRNRLRPRIPRLLHKSLVPSSCMTGAQLNFEMTAYLTVDLMVRSSPLRWKVVRSVLGLVIPKKL